MASLRKHGPYEGLRVLDFGHYLAGPLAATLFAVVIFGQGDAAGTAQFASNFSRNGHFVQI